MIIIDDYGQPNWEAILSSNYNGLAAQAKVASTGISTKTVAELLTQKPGSAAQDKGRDTAQSTTAKR